jgi:hypothetical protein
VSKKYFLPEFISLLLFDTFNELRVILFSELFFKMADVLLYKVISYMTLIHLFYSLSKPSTKNIISSSLLESFSLEYFEDVL